MDHHGATVTVVAAMVAAVVSAAVCLCIMYDDKWRLGTNSTSQDTVRKVLGKKNNPIHKQFNDPAFEKHKNPGYTLTIA